MKKNIFTIALMLFLPISLIAQTEFGIKAGVNFSHFTGDNTALISFRTSFHVGVGVEIEMSEKFYFQPELMYSSQGTKIDGGLFGFDVFESTTKVNYLNLPLMFKYYASEGFNFQFGPQVGFLLAAKTEFDASSVGAGSGEEDVKDLFESVDFGLNFGLGYKLESGLNFDARYNLGLSNINAFEEAGKNKNGVFQLSIGYFFN